MRQADPVMTADLEPSDDLLLPRLRLGEEAAFRILVRRYHVRLVAIARGAHLTREAAEEAVQEAWIAVMRNIAGFEARSSLRTWLTGIVLNIARKASVSARRTATFAELTPRHDEDEGSGFDADAFLADGHWREAPWHWSEIDLERGLAGRQVWQAVEAAIAALPPDEAAVIRHRDIEGFGPRETEELLGLGEARQRVLLDRARLKIRRVFEALTRDAARA
ncbi:MULTISPECIES: sigma-70 family RNA polymerase sigma factor [Methylobacterium]|jgi:RNA polymerase sigma-70 factor (ECF subfamily)|uniref:RNA polymerase sigma-70 factor (ECF subfamily) n=4 Tax=Alphaproteobacteria TaxID=28211 RepID=A0AAJ1TPU2_9HYPH|nr:MULTISPECIES: sigma-70 family RNA polymerase sigma factor [Methylobacterium]MCB4802341.1 sigma-70 family RNA polymerase sigma factor [Methylobacterium brachiatum]MDE4914469.1 sigma-70 family RNA polymerase sigma factor [Methylobacterium sp. 092160098-2]MDH2313450.1 sigma-70 family RNA polymerase sigma factor [Methylobacterium brachiatum]MDQ0542694.1 RNA polymerase sigma-70 factor (ECF subfamily) [Methylobacterium brachiatum]WFS05188.1 sigma-70 family RNA polymerase sigma factor [Methylobact